VFALGLLLELVGSLFFAYESQIFQRYIRHNRWWLEKILSRYGRQMDTDYDRYCRQKLLLLQKLDPRHLLLYLTLWNKGSRSKVREEILAEVWMIRTHNRIHSYLIGYLGLMNEASRVQLLYDQMRTWRVSRSLVTGLFLSYILLGVLGAVRILDVAEVSNESAGTLSTISVINFLILAGSLLISILMIFVTLRSYSRYCETLFSLAHVTAVNQDPGLATAYAPSPPDALHRAGVQKGQD